MSNTIFPTLPGQTWPRIKVVRSKTTVRQANGRRYALSTQAYPTYVFRLSYSFLRAADLAALAGFFRARRGRLDDFLFSDRDDRSVTDQAFGAGDGVTRDFQLVRALDGVVEPVFALDGTPVIKKAGSVVTPTVSTLGLVSFAVAPSSGETLTWSGSYYWRVAFTKDEQEFEEFMRSLWSAKTVEFETFIP